MVPFLGSTNSHRITQTSANNTQAKIDPKILHRDVPWMMFHRPVILAEWYGESTHRSCPVASARGETFRDVHEARSEIFLRVEARTFSCQIYLKHHFSREHFHFFVWAKSSCLLKKTLSTSDLAKT